MLKTITTFVLLVVSTVSFANEFQQDKTQCQSPLYVSGVDITNKIAVTASLMNYFAYFDLAAKHSGDSQGGVLNIAHKKVVGSEGFSVREVSKAFDGYVKSVLRGEPSTRLPRNLSDLIKLYRLVESKYQNTNDLIEAVRTYELDPKLDLTYELGSHFSLIDHVLNTHAINGDLDYIEQLINAGVPVTANSVLTGINSSSVKLLELLLPHFDESELNQRIQLSFDRRLDKYSFADYAVEVGSVEGLGLILDSGIGNTDRALETLLTSYTRHVPRDNFAAFQVLIDRYNSKLELLLNAGLSAPSNILLDASVELKPLLGSLAPRLVELAKSPKAQTMGLVEKQITQQADDYLAELKIAKSRWPQFIFSFDQNCEKVPHDSHYRVDNLDSLGDFEKWIAARKSPHQDKNAKQLEALLASKGDIYVDWYRQILHSEMQAAKNKVTQKETALNFDKNRQVMQQVYDHIEKDDWFAINSLLINLDFEVQDLAFVRNRILELALVMIAPAHLTDSWLQEGGIVGLDTQLKLITQPQYAVTVASKLEKRIDVIRPTKSVLFQASVAKNHALVEMLLASKVLDKKYTTDQGMSALTWTLLNYSADLKPQLKTLIKQQKMLEQGSLTKVQQDLLKRIETATN